MATVEGTTSISDLRAGAEIDGVFACTRKDRLIAKSGTPYLAVELRDRSGAVAARAFRNADFLAGQFERGDLVVATGRAERFRDELQIDLRSIRRAEAGDPAEFLPTAYRDLEELDGFLEHLAREIYDPDLALLPIGNQVVMSPLEAAHAARLLGVEHVVPIHYGTFPFLPGTPEEFQEHASALVPDLKVHVMKPGDDLAS